MSTVIRLARKGRKKAPFYRVVASDSRSPRDGKFIEVLGHYHPMTKQATINKERVEYYRGNGARVTPVVERIIKLV